ncbi:MAG: hypothetical protein A2086_05620 [Spirochaetes bacterium GWD1_27_9]|nr:MAG: hypothetical protein A2Z98_06740 [Spirochaetes bacterium GWB1_27_13]OHD26178.1 MAG: hypothetical protein A2Y34_08745 [Spirochaetes bacterium GWC1_27_15]OHD37618.1 MAG: hypothetical protein A2086_05620 [Spirochaetes bacterium GWD1_27_9]
MAKILVVEDSLFQRLNITNILKEKNYTFFECSNGKDAMKKLSEEYFDCLLLDLLMPEFDGIEVLKNMKQFNINVPTIIMTADIQETTKKECFNMGAKDIINKPFKKEEVLNAIEKILNNSHSN